MFLICYEFDNVFWIFLEIRCDDAGIINYYLFIYLFYLAMVEHIRVDPLLFFLVF